MIADGGGREVSMDKQISDQIARTKRALGAGSARLKDAFRRIEERIRRETEIIKAETAAGRSPLPEVDFRAVKDDKVPEAIKDAIRRRGFAVIRGVYPRAQAEDWNQEL